MYTRSFGFAHRLLLQERRSLMTCLIRACFPRLRLLKGKKKPSSKPLLLKLSKGSDLHGARDSAASACAWRMCSCPICVVRSMCVPPVHQAAKKEASTRGRHQARSAPVPHSTSHVARTTEGERESRLAISPTPWMDDESRHQKIPSLRLAFSLIRSTTSS